MQIVLTSWRRSAGQKRNVPADAHLSGDRADWWAWRPMSTNATRGQNPTDQTHSGQSNTNHCQSCGSLLTLDPRQTTVGDDGTIQHHFHCRNDACPADGGAIIVCDGRISRRLGAACDPDYDRRPTEAQP